MSIFNAPVLTDSSKGGGGGGGGENISLLLHPYPSVCYCLSV